MAVIWGLDMKELQWSKFKSSYMFGNTDYHARRTKFGIYQLAMITCVISESVGTAALSNYIDQQSALKKLNSNAIEYNNDYIGMDSYNIFAGVFVAFIFGAAFFFDLFWPERKEIPSVRMAWKVTSILASIFMAASAITKTVIVSTHSAYVEGISSVEAQRLLAMVPGNNLVYRHNTLAIVSLVFVWIGFPSVVAGTILMWRTIDHIQKFGPFSEHARLSIAKQPDPEIEAIGEREGTSNTEGNRESEKDIESQRPSQEPGFTNENS